MKKSVVFISGYGSSDRKMLEKAFPSGASVEVLGSDELGVIIGNLRIVYPLKEQICQKQVDFHTNPPAQKTSSYICSYPDCQCDLTNEVSKTQSGEWRIDVLIGQEKKPLDPWMLTLAE
jgi:hypothetical protein